MHIDLALIAENNRDADIIRASLAKCSTDAFVIRDVPSIAALGEIYSSKQPPDITLLALDLDARSSLQTLESMRKQFPEIPVVVMTTTGGEHLAEKAATFGVQNYVVNDDPESDDLARTLRLAMSRQPITSELFEQVNYDDITGLANRYLFRDRLSHAIQHAGKAPETVALLLLDIDNFKQLNLQYGRATGDQFLRSFAQAVVDKLSENDTVARLDGDEFAVILENLRYPQAALDVASELLSIAQRPIAIGPDRIQAALNIGIAFHTENRPDAGRWLIEGASAALHTARQTGENKHCTYTDKLNREIVARIERDSRLKTAQSNDEFRLYCQPIVDSSTRQIFAYETLIRWQQPGKGHVTLPGKFIESLVRLGLTQDVGKFVLRSSIERHAQWMSQCTTPISVCVNVCASQVSDPGFTDLVRSALEDFDLCPRLLSLELTENLLINDSPEIRRMFAELSDLGVRFSIDDFGTGHNSYSYLKNFPISTLKIDRSFTRLLHVDRIDRAIARSQINLARELGMQVIAEGVENHLVLSELEVLRPDGLQGFLIGRPMPASRFERQFIRPLMAVPESALAL